MTRKDYQTIANVFKAFEIEGLGRPMDDRDNLAYNFADALELENPRFDRNRFLIACGVYTD